MSDDEQTQVLRRTFTAPLESREGRILEGCCVPYGEAQKVRDSPTGPSYFEVFEPGAFAKQLRAADKVELRYEHGTGLADSVGICRTLYEEAHGLFGTFAIHAGAFGDQALELVRSGILPGFSVEFQDRFRHWRRNAQGAVVRQKCLLLSVGLVRVPAFPTALVTAMRSREEMLGDLDLPGLDDAQLERLRGVGIEV
jgi:HK97 family phage prohead protease